MELLDYILIGVAILCILILLFPFYFKFRVNHILKLDQLMQKEKDRNRLMFLYRLNPKSVRTTLEIIDQYTIENNKGKKTCTFSFREKLKHVKYYVYCYNISNKLISVIEVTERNTSIVSKELTLPKKCKKINVRVSEVADVVIDPAPFHQTSSTKKIFYAAAASILSFIAIYLPSYKLMQDEFNSIKDFEQTLYLVLACVSFFIFIFLSLFLLRKNRIGKEESL